jgi:cell wall-associated NlpC family hydrolase
MARAKKLVGTGLVLLVALLAVGALITGLAGKQPDANLPRVSAARSIQPLGAPASSAESSRPASAGLVPDPQAAQSAPAPPSVHHAPAVAPAYAAVAAGAPSDAEVRKELRAMKAAENADRSRASSRPGTTTRIARDGTVSPRAGVPLVIAQVIAGANAITNFPYVFGGGHASFIDSAYDCSGSVSYALAAGGLVSAPQTSGELESWGAPGPGRRLTVYANAGHVYMFVDGLRYDTSGRTGVFSTRWQTGPDPGAGPSNAGMVARHYPGL